MASQGMYRQVVFALVLALAMVCLAVAQGNQRLLGAAMAKQVESLFGDKGKQALLQWAQFIVSQGDEYKADKEQQTLVKVNHYFNTRMAFVSDEQHWKKQDYWATPLESLTTQAGDCEDYVIAKYFSLIQAGVEQEKLRITYVKALKLNQAHMVLAYYATPKSDPLILDNINPKILPASKRRDLAPVYSFNGMGMWIERQQGTSIKVGSASRLSMWMDVLLRMQQQGLQPWLDLPNTKPIQ
ncbi:MAG: putative transglutaminase-like cysteine proteinase [Oceanicoccus sp.]|jgi:predicted transglutaminase-like cysteine proteinase